MIEIRKPGEVNTSLTLLYVHKEALDDIKTVWLALKAAGISLDDLLPFEHANKPLKKPQSPLKTRRVLKQNDVFLWLYEKGLQAVNDHLKVYKKDDGTQLEIRNPDYAETSETRSINLKTSKQSMVDIDRAKQRLNESGFRNNEGLELSKIKILLYILINGRTAFNQEFKKYKINITSPLYR
jgi:hypothetical protein